MGSDQLLTMTTDRFKYIFHEAFTMGSTSSVVLKIGGATLAMLSAFIMPIYQFLLIVGALVAADFATGAWKAVKNNVKFTSGGMKRTVEKTALYFVAIIASYGVEWVFISGGPQPWKYGLTYVAAGFIAATELKSILENVGEATGIGIWERVKSVLEGLMGKSDKDKNA